MSLSDLFRCVCSQQRCAEHGVNWDRNLRFTHIRIDGCVIATANIQKCDCLILHFPEDSNKIVMFFVECKTRAYHLSEVQQQIENSINIVATIFREINRAVIVPVCYAESHSSAQSRSVSSYKVHSPKGPLEIKLLDNGEDICRALR